MTSKPPYERHEVCKIVGVQPYVLQFWETEFPSLASYKGPDGQSLYTSEDLLKIGRIKAMLYEKGYTIPGVRTVLEEESIEAGGLLASNSIQPLAPQSSTNEDSPNDAVMAVTPEEASFDLGRVCKLLQLQPYVLRYWETEFPQLASGKNIGGKRYYNQRDIAVIDRAKTLLYEEGYTIAGAKKVIEQESALGEIIYKKDLGEEATYSLQADLLCLDRELIEYLSRHPRKMYELSPRKFEELVASLLRNHGFDIELTSRGADGGVDIFATQKNIIGESLLVVDCKRYAPERHVGVGIVRALYGVSQQLNATMALLATTSFFTKSAENFQIPIRHKLSLRGYNDLVNWLNSFRG